MLEFQCLTRQSVILSVLKVGLISNPMTYPRRNPSFPSIDNNCFMEVNLTFRGIETIPAEVRSSAVTCIMCLALST